MEVLTQLNPPVTNPPVTNPPIPVTNPPITNPEEPSTDLQYLAIIGGSIAVIAAGGVQKNERKQGKSSPVIQTETVSKPKNC